MIAFAHSWLRSRRKHAHYMVGAIRRSHPSNVHEHEPSDGRMGARRSYRVINKFVEHYSAFYSTPFWLGCRSASAFMAAKRARVAQTFRQSADNYHIYPFYNSSLDVRMCTWGIDASNISHTLTKALSYKLYSLFVCAPNMRAIANTRRCP